MREFYAAILMSSALASCNVQHEYIRPQHIEKSRFIDEIVNVCGERTDAANIDKISTLSGISGLTITKLGPLSPTYRGKVCVIGKITYVGCGVTTVCTDAAFEYGIDIAKFRAH